jgi:hypothetical protein
MSTVWAGNPRGTVSPFPFNSSSQSWARLIRCHLRADGEWVVDGYPIPWPWFDQAGEGVGKPVVRAVERRRWFNTADSLRQSGWQRGATRRRIEGHRRRKHVIVWSRGGEHALEPFAATRQAVTHVAVFQADPWRQRLDWRHAYPPF